MEDMPLAYLQQLFFMHDGAPANSSLSTCSTLMHIILDAW